MCGIVGILRWGGSPVRREEIAQMTGSIVHRGPDDHGLLVEGGLGMTLLPGITLEAGILKGTRLVARRFSPPVPSRTLALVARRKSPRRRDADLLADFLIDEHRGTR